MNAYYWQYEAHIKRARISQKLGHNPSLSAEKEAERLPFFYIRGDENTRAGVRNRRSRLPKQESLSLRWKQNKADFFGEVCFFCLWFFQSVSCCKSIIKHFKSRKSKRCPRVRIARVPKKKFATSCDCLKNYIKRSHGYMQFSKKAHKKKFEHLLYTQYIF